MVVCSVFDRSAGAFHDGPEARTAVWDGLSGASGDRVPAPGKLAGNLSGSDEVRTESCISQLQ